MLSSSSSTQEQRNSREGRKKSIDLQTVLVLATFFLMLVAVSYTIRSCEEKTETVESVSASIVEGNLTFKARGSAGRDLWIV
jgi:hypothetical protein